MSAGAPLYRLGVKLFAADAGVELVELIPVFHRWIQRRMLDDMLVDVADYSHVQAGPGIVLVAHEGNYGFEECGGRRGLVYYSKRPLDGALEQDLHTVCRKALDACQRLEGESLDPPVRFGGDAIQVFSNDRLAAPNTEAGYLRVEPAVRALLDRLYGGESYALERAADPRERLALTARVQRARPVQDLLARLAA